MADQAPADRIVLQNLTCLHSNRLLTKSIILIKLGIKLSIRVLCTFSVLQHVKMPLDYKQTSEAFLCSL